MDDTTAQLLEAIRRFVNERLIPLEAKVAEDDAIPAEALQEMRDLGMFGLSIPEEFGGLGLSMEDECRAMFEFCRCSPAFRSAFGTNVGIGSQGLVMFGTEAQKQKYLPDIIAGRKVVAIAVTEPGAGSDVAGMR
ncbi:MAG TPA: acyl-CoA dehydrogenase family protein, partial [Terricaulis sp.]|nr:acyl-CoA dehydrogenase family protein [Terricaulis sp.]